MPALTVAITTFNRARYLERAIRSVLAQEFADFELLILDNSSTDGTDELIRSIQDRRLRHIRHAPCNISRSRNIGVREAAGGLLAFLDDDDEWLPNKLHHQAAVFRSGDDRLGLVYGGFVRFDDRGREFEMHRPVLEGRVLLSLLWQKDAFTGSASNPVLRTAIVRRLGGYDEGLTTSEDWELYLRLAEQYDVKYVPHVVLRIRRHTGARLGDRIDDARKLEEHVLERYGRMMPPGLRGFYLRKIGGKLCRSGRTREGRRRILEAVKTSPFNPGGYAQFGLSFLGGGAYRRVHTWYKRLA